uniref:F-box domain-containing protein n=1 Tax=Meloidogyne hapla TaxID=6305 RepID=A0A1I8AWP8_MELHA
MYNLPLESKLDVLKYLNIEQLTSFRQTNRYFNALIGRYEEELARQELDIIDFDNVYPHVDYEFINIEDGVFKLKMNNQLKKKWRSALNRQIPLYLNITDYNKKTIKLREG